MPEAKKEYALVQKWWFWIIVFEILFVFSGDIAGEFQPFVFYDFLGYLGMVLAGGWLLFPAGLLAFIDADINKLSGIIGFGIIPVYWGSIWYWIHKIRKKENFMPLVISLLLLGILTMIGCTRVKVQI